VSRERCRIAILGYGTVGSAVARRLTGPHAPAGLELTHIFDRHAARKREALVPEPGASSVAWTTDIGDVLTADLDVVIETIGGLEPAADWTRAALAAGKSVVTANKQVIARHGHALRALAADRGRQLRFEAAVGGAMPIVRTVGDGLAGDRLTRIVAILNGTTNAVLSRMESTGCSLDAAVADARACGYAEADPSVDLDGGDAAAKLSILCGLAFGMRVDPDAIPTRTTASITAADFERARVSGGTIRQLAHAEFNHATATLAAWVAPTFVSRTSIFAATSGPQNAAIISGAHSGDITISGAGAGGDATAVAVLSDVLAVARENAVNAVAEVL
jgi:homoserine dehydrogenase